MNIDCDFEGPVPRRAALGLIVLQVDETLERDLRILMPDDVLIYHSRIPSGADLNPDTIAEMADALPRAAELLPEHAKLDAIGYACTSGATVLGEKRVEALVQSAHPGVHVTNPLSALKAACNALGLFRVALLSPYVASVSDAVVKHLGAHAISVPAFASFEQEAERRVARISPNSIENAMVALGQRDDCDAVFASCTNLRAVEVLGAVERRLEKPALSSTQVLAWHLLRLAGVESDLPGFGRLGRAALAP